MGLSGEFYKGSDFIKAFLQILELGDKQEPLFHRAIFMLHVRRHIRCQVCAKEEIKAKNLRLNLNENAYS